MKVGWYCGPGGQGERRTVAGGMGRTEERGGEWDGKGGGDVVQYKGSGGLGGRGWELGVRNAVGNSEVEEERVGSEARQTGVGFSDIARYVSLNMVGFSATQGKGEAGCDNQISTVGSAGINRFVLNMWV